MSYSTDLRTRVLSAIDRGMPRAEVSTTFQVGASTIKRWLALRRRTGTLTPTSPPGRAATIPPRQYPALLAQLTAQPDATLTQHVAQWADTYGVRVSRWTMSRAITAAGWTRKKSR